MGFPLREEGCDFACGPGGRWIHYNLIHLPPTSQAFTHPSPPRGNGATGNELQKKAPVKTSAFHFISFTNLYLPPPPSIISSILKLKSLFFSSQSKLTPLKLAGFSMAPFDIFNSRSLYKLFM